MALALITIALVVNYLTLFKVPKFKISQPKKIEAPEQPQQKTTPETLAYILSFLEYTPLKNQIDIIIFNQIKKQSLGKKIDLNKIIIQTHQKKEKETIYESQNFLLLEDKVTSTREKNDALKSGMIFGKAGVSYKFVIPVADDRIINILKIGVEPNQIEDIQKTTVSPKAHFEVIVPLD